jgi:hypothetical protein
MLFGVPELKSIGFQLTVSTRVGESVELLQQIVEIELPDRVRRTVLVGDQEQIVVINGNRGYIGGAGLALPLPEPQLRQALDQLRRDLLVLAAGAGSEELRVASGGSAAVGALRCDVLDLSYGAVDSRLFVAADGDVIKQSFGGSDPLTGATGLVEIVYSGYREFDGVRFPSVHAISFEGQPIVTVQIGAISVNPQFDPSLFAVSDSD